MLALNGNKDMEVVDKENLPAIEEALQEGSNKDFTVRALLGLNHMFQTCETGADAEIYTIEETLAPVLLQTICDWIVRHSSAASGK